MSAQAELVLFVSFMTCAAAFLIVWAVLFIRALRECFPKRPRVLRKGRA